MKMITAIVGWLLATGCQSQEIGVQEGDVIFHTSRSAQSQAIQIATKSKYSHMGIILNHNGKPVVFEAVGPVKYTPLDSWISRGQNSHYVIKRLKNSTSLLTKDALDRLHQSASAFEGKLYDFTFEWDDSRIYCSELVWKLYDRAIGLKVGRLQKFREFDISSPSVNETIKERYGSNLPLEETVISPQAIFESELFETIKTVGRAP